MKGYPRVGAQGLEISGWEGERVSKGWGSGFGVWEARNLHGHHLDRLHLLHWLHTTFPKVNISEIHFDNISESHFDNASESHFDNIYESHFVHQSTRHVEINAFHVSNGGARVSLGRNFDCNVTIIV